MVTTAWRCRRIAAVRRDREVLISQIPQPGGLGQSEHRNQTASRHEIRIVERHRRRAQRVREFHLRDVPRVSVESLPEELRFPRHARAFSLYATLDALTSSVDRG
jgi:hypothetical protein